MSDKNDSPYDFTPATIEDLHLIADNANGYFAERYQAAAREELARRIAAPTPPAPAGEGGE